MGSRLQPIRSGHGLPPVACFARNGIAAGGVPFLAKRATRAGDAGFNRFGPVTGYPYGRRWVQLIRSGHGLPPVARFARDGIAAGGVPFLAKRATAAGDAGFNRFGPVTIVNVAKEKRGEANDRVFAPIVGVSPLGHGGFG